MTARPNIPESRRWLVHAEVALVLVMAAVLLAAGCIRIPNLDYQPDSDIVIVKLAPNATIEWSKVIDSGGDDHVHSIIQTPDNNYVIVASSQPGRHPGTYGLMKFSQDKILWNVSFLKTDVPALETKCSGPVILARNGDLIAGGLCRINPDGIVLWNRSLPGNYGIYAVIETRDGGFLIGGDHYDDNMTLSGSFVAKTDQTGNLSWQVLLNKDEISGPVNFLFQLPNDPGYIARTSKDSVRLDMNGNVVSIQNLNYEVPESENGTINGEPLTNYIPYSPGLVFYNKSGMTVAKLVLRNASGNPTRTSDEGYISAGIWNSQSYKITDNNLHVVKLHQDGTIEWDRNVSGILINGVSQIVQTSDGGYILTGEYDKEWEDKFRD